MALYDPTAVKWHRPDETRVRRGPPTELHPRGARLSWSMPSTPAPPAPAPRHELFFKEAYQDSAVTPMEWLGQLAGASTFKEPSVGRSTKPSRTTPLDVAAALGCVEQPLKQHLAYALATMTAATWPVIQPLAWPLLIEDLLASHRTRSLVAGHRKLRARLMLHVVFHDLALRRPPRPALDGARLLGVAVRDYRALYRAIAAFIDTYAQEGAGEARRRFGRGE